MAERFGELSDTEIKVLLDKSTPKCTERATKFGIKVFDGKLKLSLYNIRAFLCFSALKTYKKPRYNICKQKAFN